MKHIMVDLETYSSRTNAAIASIGAVEFDPATGELGKQFYEVIKTESLEYYKFDIQLSTVKWWMGQNEEARKALCNPDKVMAIHQALYNFCKYWEDVSQKNYFWSHATFDSVVLRNAYEKVGLITPWHYRDCMDIRTLVALAPKNLKKELFETNRGGLTHHNALDDAIYQAGYVSKIWQTIKGESK